MFILLQKPYLVKWSTKDGSQKFPKNCHMNDPKLHYHIAVYKALLFIEFPYKV